MKTSIIQIATQILYQVHLIKHQFGGCKRYSRNRTEQKEKEKTGNMETNASKKNSIHGYVGIKGSFHLAKGVKAYPHSCHYKCKEISEDDRANLFSKFWNLQNQNHQSAFLQFCLKVITPCRRTPGARKHKMLGTTTKLNGKRFYKQFFLCTLDISNKIFTNIVKNHSDTGVPCTN